MLAVLKLVCCLLQLKRRAREAGEEAEAGVTLASTADVEAEEVSDQEEEEGDVSAEQESDDDTDGMAYEGGLSSSDEDDGNGIKQSKHEAPAARSAAYFGMLKKSNVAPAKEYEGLSLVEQEALALRMIKK